jgi:hypothetical protein
MSRRFGILILTALVSLSFTLTGHAQETDRSTQAVSSTGLLPVYGVDFTFDPAWVDGARFPSQSAAYSNFGVNAVFKQVWDALKPSGFNVIRFPVDARDAQGAANRVANLCVWAKNNNVRLVPILTGADRGRPLGADYGANVSTFIKALLGNLRSGDGKYLEAYAQILGYQLENEMNHQGLHGAMQPDSARLRLLLAAGQLRRAEQEGLKQAGVNATPLIVNASFDCELIKARAIAGATLDDSAYAKAYESLKQFLSDLTASADIDLVSVDWFAGSLSAGGVDGFGQLLQRLSSDFAGKQLVFTTGFSTGFRSSEEQRKFYTLAFANLADYRTTAGADSPFIGVFFHESLNGKETGPAPPGPGLAGEIAKWDWPARADELARVWTGQGQSDALARWLHKVENNFGLLTLNGAATGNPTVIAQPGQEALQQINSSVSEANSAAPGAAADPSADSTPTAPTSEPVPAGEPGSTNQSSNSTWKTKAQVFLTTLLDHALDKLINKLSGNGTLSNGYQDAVDLGSNPPSGTPADYTGGPGSSPTDGNPAGAIRIESASAGSAGLRTGEAATFSVVLRNQGSTQLSGLMVALVDDTGELAQVSDVVVGPGASLDVQITWTPPETRTYEITVRVLDGFAQTIASAQLPLLSVAPGRVVVDPVRQNRPVGLPQFSLGLAAGLAVGQPAAVSLSVSNPYAYSFINLKTTLFVDGKRVEGKNLSGLLSKQNRSIQFASLSFPQAGSHEVKVTLEGVGAKKPLVGTITKQVLVSSTPVAPATPTKSGSAQPVTPVRPVVAPSGRDGAKAPAGSGGTQHDQPVSPIQPARTTQPAKLTEPVRPIQPAKPTAPVRPTQPPRLTEPVRPTQPPRSTQPPGPSAPPRTTQPTKPTQPPKTPPAPRPVQPARPKQPLVTRR